MTPNSYQVAVRTQPDECALTQQAATTSFLQPGHSTLKALIRSASAKAPGEGMRSDRHRDHFKLLLMDEDEDDNR